MRARARAFLVSAEDLLRKSNPQDIAVPVRLIDLTDEHLICQSRDTYLYMYVYVCIYIYIYLFIYAHSTRREVYKRAIFRPRRIRKSIRYFGCASYSCAYNNSIVWKVPRELP